jgi:hypothetical protein
MQGHVLLSHSFHNQSALGRYIFKAPYNFHFVKNIYNVLL